MNSPYIPIPTEYYSLVEKNIRKKKYLNFKIENFNNNNLLSSGRRNFLSTAELLDNENNNFDISSYLKKYFLGFWLNDFSGAIDLILNLREYWLIFLIYDDIFLNNPDFPTLSQDEIRDKKIFSFKLSELLGLIEFKLFLSHILFCFWEVTNKFNSAYCYYNRDQPECFLIKETKNSRFVNIPFLLKKPDGEIIDTPILEKDFNDYYIKETIESEPLLKFNIHYKDYSEGIHLFSNKFENKTKLIPNFALFEMFLRFFIFDVIIFNSGMEKELLVNDRFIKSFFASQPPSYGLIQ